MTKLGLRDLNLAPAEARLLWRMSMFCEEWEGKVIEYTSGPGSCMPGRTEKGLVIGHDGPRFSDDRGWYRPDLLEGGLGFGGWGCVMIMHTPGRRHFTDPALLDSVREIRRDRDEHSAYEHEAVDLYCPYGCDADGRREWDIDWSGPEYEAFCPIHSRAAYERGRDLYHCEDGFDGSRPDLEREYYDLTKFAYKDLV